MGEGLKTAMYILNRVPSKAVAKTPFNYGHDVNQAWLISEFGDVQLRLGFIIFLKRN